MFEQKGLDHSVEPEGAQRVAQMDGPVQAAEAAVGLEAEVPMAPPQEAALAAQPDAVTQPTTNIQSGIAILEHASRVPEQLAAALKEPLSLALRANVHELAELLLEGLRAEVRDMISSAISNAVDAPSLPETSAAPRLRRPRSQPLPPRTDGNPAPGARSPRLEQPEVDGRDIESFDSMAGVPLEESSSLQSKSLEKTLGMDTKLDKSLDKSICVDIGAPRALDKSLSLEKNSELGAPRALDKSLNLDTGAPRALEKSLNVELGASRALDKSLNLEKNSELGAPRALDKSLNLDTGAPRALEKSLNVELGASRALDKSLNSDRSFNLDKSFSVDRSFHMDLHAPSPEANLAVAQVATCPELAELEVPQLNIYPSSCASVDVLPALHTVPEVSRDNTPKPSYDTEGQASAVSHQASMSVNNSQVNSFHSLPSLPSGNSVRNAPQAVIGKAADVSQAASPQVGSLPQPKLRQLRRVPAGLCLLDDLEQSLDIDLFKNSQLLDSKGSRGVRVPLPSQRKDHRRRLSSSGGPLPPRGRQRGARVISEEFIGIDCAISESECSSVGDASSDVRGEASSNGNVPKVSHQDRTSMYSIHEYQCDTESSQRSGQEHSHRDNGSEDGKPLWRCINRLPMLLPSLCGVVPLTSQRAWISSPYQWLVLAFCLCNAINCARRAIVASLAGDIIMQSSLPVDITVAFGSLFGLLACGSLRGSGSFVTCTQLITSYAQRQDLLRHWEKQVFCNVCCSALLWAGAIALRAVFVERSDLQVWLNVSSFALSGCVLLGISAYFLRTCICLTLMIDRFCCNVVVHSDFAEALKEWKLIHALCRAVSRTVQNSFMTSQTTAVAAALLVIAAWGSQFFTKSLLPLVFIFFALVHASALASRITDKCARASILVNSSAGGDNFDSDRMYVVDYIERSMTGFHVFDVRIASSTILKSFYVACALAFAVATRAV
eukprot:TRINITY_DN8252_c0_g1_i1.p1 TRINITY_DN8252_c0_g1~~TRINITY_DN8252_c0_g1_i1.p1  ORF type:complete len:963 (+),score=78.68 TRINITY_DN8252_c0_g1_i1:39-2891(+)